MDRVGELLDGVRLSQYKVRFSSQGYDNLLDLCLLDDNDLDALYIEEEEHRKIILEAVSCIETKEWLTYHGLDSYIHNFGERFRTLGELKTARVTDDILDECEIMVPGHRKRLLCAMEHLKAKLNFTVEGDVLLPEEGLSVRVPLRAVAIGAWRRPDGLTERPDHEFLCVKGHLKGKGKKDSIRLDFLVDSGSEVVTAREEIIHHLQLESSGKVQSRGIHAAVEKDIYNALLVLGGEEIEVEVMPDSYNTVGTTVLRHFKHYINGTRHLWLKVDES